MQGHGSSPLRSEPVVPVDGGTEVLNEITVLLVGEPPSNPFDSRVVCDDAGALRIVGRAAPGAQLMSAVAQLHPQVVLVGLAPAVAGIDAVRSLTGQVPDMGVVVVTPRVDGDTFVAAIHAGARGCLAGGVSLEELTRAIRVVHSGGVMFDARCGAWAIEQLVKPAIEKPFPELTQREHEVLELVADGRATTAIARELGLSVKTIRNYLSRIFAKLHLADRAQAAVHARRAGLGH